MPNYTSLLNDLRNTIRAWAQARRPVNTTSAAGAPIPLVADIEFVKNAMLKRIDEIESVDFPAAAKARKDAETARLAKKEARQADLTTKAASESAERVATKKRPKDEEKPKDN